MNKNKMLTLIDRCRRSPEFFLSNFVKVKHPGAGEIPFHLHSYQKTSLGTFRDKTRSIFRKTRQSGISTLAGGYALWFIMFFKMKTVLVTSKRDMDAKEFLSRNVKFAYESMPDWFKEMFPMKPNEHMMHMLRTDSRVISLPGGKDTLRSNSSSLNIIDEAAFTPHMQDMWDGGQSTIVHGGGRVIVISTPGNIGDWYWNTYTDAKSGANDFHPIEVEWHDMDWVIEFNDPSVGRRVRIAPRDGIRSTTPEEKPIYGDYWSPWLETQYRDLQRRGEVGRFAREILGRFEGTGSTVVPYEKIKIVEDQVKLAPPHETASIVSYVQPVTGENVHLDFKNELWVWKRPINDRPSRKDVAGRVLDPGYDGHRYVIGVDSSTGEDKDLAAIEILDINALEQVAEYTDRVDASTIARMADYLGRWYNNARVVVERTGYGMAVIQDLRDRLHYPNLWRQTVGGNVGFNTSSTTKPLLNKQLIDWCGQHQIRSHRLHKQLSMYVNLRANKFGNQPGPGNHDDLVMAMGLALIGLDASAYEPVGVYTSNSAPALKSAVDVDAAMASGALLPMMFTGVQNDELMEIDKFSRQLLSTFPKEIPAVVRRGGVR